MQVVAVLGPAVLRCRVAMTAAEQARGLQDVPPLDWNEAMVFPLRQSTATFHMGRVAYPIDLVFVREGRVTRIVHAAQPGARDVWSAPADTVIETCAGRCAAVEPGHRVVVGTVPTPSIMSMGEDDPSPERFRDHALPDEGPNAHDQPIPGFEQRFGPASWGADGPVGPSSRVSSRLRRLAQLDPGIEDPGLFVAQAVNAIVDSGLRWEVDMLNGGRTESAVLSPDALRSAIAAQGLTPAAMRAIDDILTSPDALLLEIIGDELLAANFAQRAMVVAGMLVLHRGIKRPQQFLTSAPGQLGPKGTDTV